MPYNAQLLKLLKNALAKRQVLRKNTNAIRLVNGRGDHLEGLVLEQYNRHFVAQVFISFWIRESLSLRDFLTEHFQVDYYILKDRTSKGSLNHNAFNVQVLVEKADSKAMVCENSILFEVDLNNTLNTGLFLDMRNNRKFVGQSCKNQKVLNCFSYTCSFGAYARAYGAKGVINIDISQKILDQGRRNYRLNQLTMAPHEFTRADAMVYLERAVKKNNCFDVIILDPPSFARTKENVFSVQKDLARLIELAGRVLNKGGKIFVSTNLSGISHLKLEQCLRASSPRKDFKKIIRLGQDVDFVGSGRMKESHLSAVWVEY